MDTLPLRYWTPGETLDVFSRPRVISAFFTGRNFSGVLLTRTDADTWSVWTTNVHGIPSEIQQGREEAARSRYRVTVRAALDSM